MRLPVVRSESHPSPSVVLSRLLDESLSSLHPDDESRLELDVYEDDPLDLDEDVGVDVDELRNEWPPPTRASEMSIPRRQTPIASIISQDRVSSALLAFAVILESLPI